MSYLIRPLRPDESKAYRAIRLEALKAYPESFGSKYEEQVVLDQLYFEKRIIEADERAILFGVFDADQLVGICGLIQPPNRASGIIIQMYVQPAHQGNQLGQQLLQRIQEHAKVQLKLDSLALEVGRTNTAAIKTYQQFGFQDEQPKNPYGSTISMILAF
ncbi:MAG: GNAT family N-acetyltransferase [Bacteroidota bacterium]